MNTAPVAETFACPDARYVRTRANLAGFRQECVADGTVRAAEDIADQDTSKRLMAKIHRDGGAYPLGYSVEVFGGLVTKGWGSI